MWIWVGPRWMRPGGRFARIMWLVSLPVAAFMLWFAWGPMGPPPTGPGLVFLPIWTVGVVAIEAVNFRTLYLGRGRRAEAYRAALDRQDAERGS